MAWQMAIAAVAHMYVFSAEPYHFVPAFEYGEVTTETAKAEVKLEGDDTTAVIETKEIQIEAPGTSISESVQDIVLEGGQRVSHSLSFMLRKFIGYYLFIPMPVVSRLSRMLY